VRVRDVDGEAGMSERVVIELHHGESVTRIERATTRWGDAEPQEIVHAVQAAADEVKRMFEPAPQAEDEHAPEVTVKGSYILERRPADDFDRPGLVGFCANPGEPR
jgi:hypothetical protein